MKLSKRRPIRFLPDKPEPEPVVEVVIEKKKTLLEKLTFGLFK